MAPAVRLRRCLLRHHQGLLHHEEGPLSTREELSPTAPSERGDPSMSRAGEANTDESLEQVRNLLFGTTMRNQDRRVGRVEERIARETAALRSDVTLRLDATRDELALEIAALSQSLTEERAARERTEAEAAARIEQLRSSLELRLEELRTEAAAAHDELHSQAQEQALGARDEGRTARADDRRAMARLFSEMAARLGDEPSAAEARG